MPELRVVCGGGQKFNVEIIDDVVTLGRARDNQVILPDRTVSRNHAKLIKTPDGYLLMDLDSRNGTYVNGSLISGRIMRHNDLVEVGASNLTYLDAQEVKTDIKIGKSRPRPKGQKRQRREKIKPLTIYDRVSGHAVLASIKSDLVLQDEDLLPGLESDNQATGEIRLMGLEKSNKILYVLYQLSRQLNRSPDFDALLKTAMDVIFRVVDADYGFIVTLGQKPGEIVPQVVKYRTAKDAKRAGDLEMDRDLFERVIEEKLSLLTTDQPKTKKVKSKTGKTGRSVLSVPLWRKDEVLGMIQIQSFDSKKKFDKQDLDFLSTLSGQMSMTLEQAGLMEKVRREEILRSRLTRFHSPEIVDLIIDWESEDMATILAPKGKTVTVLFMDIVDFTQLSERIKPNEMSKLLNRYFSEMTDIIFRHHGTLDKYIGDAIMAVFGAPVERGNDAERAILAALDMRRALFQMMKKTESGQRFNVRLGINTGRVVAGNLGSPQRMDYTVIGDVVNIASRLESIADPNQILIGNATYECVKKMFTIRKLGRRTIKGKTEAVTVYEVLE